MEVTKFRPRSIDPSVRLTITVQTTDQKKENELELTQNVLIQNSMQAEERNEIQLIRALAKEEIILVPEIETVPDYETLYKPDCERSKFYIKLDNLTEEEQPEYEMDTSDEEFFNNIENTTLTPLRFETIIDYLEKNSTEKVKTLEEAIKRFPKDELNITTVYEYWLRKRLKHKCKLIPSVPNKGGVNDDYVAFRKRNCRITRREKQNSVLSYINMLRLQNDLTKSIQLLQLIKQRETNKKKFIEICLEIFKKRCLLGDYDGYIINSIHSNYLLSVGLCNKPVRFCRKVKNNEQENCDSEVEDDGPFTFHRKPGVLYNTPTDYFTNTTPTVRKFSGWRVGRGGRFTFHHFNDYIENVEPNYLQPDSYQVFKNYFKVNDLPEYNVPDTLIVDVNNSKINCHKALIDVNKLV